MKIGVLFAGAALLAAQPGPVTKPVPTGAGGKDVYVAAGAASGNGSRERPFASLAEALKGASAGTRVLVAAGTYAARELPLSKQVGIYGGFDPRTWRRDVAAHRTVLDAGGQGRVFRCADGAVLDGLVIRRGRVRGLGGALLCDGMSPVLTNTVWEENETLGPQPWTPKHIHEDANDGGAVACVNGCQATIENNLFFRNRTENGRGGALAVTKSSPRIVGNVFLENDSGLADPMRSSDGGAVSIYDHANPEFRGNLVIRNRALSKNDAGGVFVALWASPRVEGNVFVDNYADDDAGGLFVGGQKHHYSTPLDPLPPASAFFVPVEGNTFAGNRNSTKNSGAFRITMESRGRFVNNVVAGNEGAYFQRSEMEIAQNTFLDEVLFTETKTGLQLPSFVNNILWKGLRMDVGGTVKGNLSRAALGVGEQNQTGDPKFASDGATVVAERASYDAQCACTELLLREALPAGDWTSRPVQAGDEWTAVRKGSGKSLFVWGDFTRVRTFVLQPTYALAAGSAAVDRGVASGIQKDMRGRARPMGAAPDIGAHEMEQKR